ncbi:uncharacterized protein BX664DRAFT_354846 [Halteromyces radiatus]|uniref:uncharacterized protein n=1 Tax=Halteromyces radiatus TaxID=101107 RepID=UPI00221E6A0C|nr:uncharacterized protein BX664DRAFT_354846 [Halteromyces radiatus]KAI8099425.1 hypothetical protein BX664DRAFT_354846 [Halteromyces radiatus]
MFKTVLLAIASAALVSAQSIVSITSPLGNNVYTAGGQATITWTNPTVDVIPQIELSKGPSTALQPVLQVATNVSAKDMQYTWNIPTTVAAGSDYAFVLGISPNLSYSGQFTINAAGGSAASGSSSASTPASSSAAAGSSSSSAAASGSSGSSAASKPSSSPSSSPANSAAGKSAPVAVSAMAIVGAAAIALM